MDIKGIMRAYRYSTIEQTPDPKTGERRVPPSIKFFALFIAFTLMGVLFVAYAAKTPGDEGGDALGGDPTPTGGNNTTQESRMPAPIVSQAPAVAYPALVAAVRER